MKKRILSMLLVIVMVLSMVPVSALAEGELKITSTKTSKYVVIGEDEITLTATKSDGTAPDGSLTWAVSPVDALERIGSENPTEFKFEGKTQGDVTIKVTDEEGNTGTEKLTFLLPPANLEIVKDTKEPVSGDLKVGDTVALGYTCSNEDDIYPAYITSNWKLLSVNPAGALTLSDTGVVTAVAEGEAEVRLALNGRSVTKKFTITPADPPVPKEMTITSTPDTHEMYPNRTLTLEARADGVKVEDVKWTSSNPSIATVNENTGEVKSGPTTGAVTVTAEKDGYNKATYEISIVPNAFRITDSEGNEVKQIKADQTVNLQVWDLSNTAQPYFKWTSSNDSIATVDATGKLTGVTPGSATITATKGGCTVTCDVTVEKTPLTIEEKNGAAKFYVGKTYQLVASADGAEMTDVTWASDDNKAIAINKDTGEMTVLAAGVGKTITVTATPDKPDLYAAATLDVKAQANALVITDKSGNAVSAVNVNETVDLVAKDGNGDTVEGVVWGSSDKEQTFVSLSKTGSLTGIRQSSTPVTITVSKDSYTTGTAEISVVVKSFEIRNSDDQPVAEVDMAEDSKMQLKAVDGDGKALNVVWSCKDSRVTVDNTGLVTVGKSTRREAVAIEASLPGYETKTVYVKVSPEPVFTAVKLAGDESNRLAVGDTRKMIALDADGLEVEDVTWGEPSNGFASVNGDELTGVQEGKVTITAKKSGYTDKDLVVDVYARPEEHIELEEEVPEEVLAGKSVNLKASVVDAAGEPVPKTSVKWTMLSEEEGVRLLSDKLDTDSNMRYRHEIKLRAEAVGCEAEPLEVTVMVVPVTTGITLKVGEEKVNNEVFIVDLSDDYIAENGIIVSASVLPASATPKVRWEISDPGNVCTEEQLDTDLLLVPVSALKSGVVTVKAYAGDGTGVSATAKIQFSKLGAGDLKDAPKKLRGGASLDLKPYLVQDKDLDDKSVTWSLTETDPDTDGVIVKNGKSMKKGKVIATISKTGKLTTKPVTEPTPVTVKITGSNGEPATHAITLYPAAKSVKISCDALKAENYTVELSKEKSERTFNFEAAIKPDVLQEENVWPLIWSSTNNDIATVDEDGQVVVKKAGKVRIDCMINDGSRIKGSINLKVTSTANSVTVTPNGRTLASGNSLDMKAVIKTPTGRKAANQEVIWSITDELGNATSAAIISATGRVTAYDVDRLTEVLVTATSKQDKTVFGSVVLTIKPNTTKTLHAYIDGNMVSGTISMNLNDSNVLGAKWQKSGSGKETVAEDCQFFSSNTNVATIDKDLGTLKAVGHGSSTITLRCVDPATQNICTSTFTVKVVKKVGFVTISAPSLRDLRSGKSVTLKATAWNDYANGVKADNQGFTWEVTENGKETNVATINSSGVLTAKTVTKKHTVVVKAISKEGGIFATATFYIFPAENVKFYFGLNGEEYTGTLPVDLGTGLGGLTVRIHTAFADSKGNISEKDYNSAGVTWSTSDKTVIQITGTGLKALKVGKATLTAKYKIGNTTYESKITAIVNRTMGSVKSIEQSSILVAGKSINLRAVPANSNATNKNVLWSVEPDSYSDNVTINMYTGKLSAKKGIGGYAVTVTATPVDGSTPKSTIVNVFAATTKVQISDGTDPVNGTKVSAPLSDGTVQFYAAAKPTEAYQTSFKWTSSDTSVATVDGNGKVTIKKAGATTIKAIAQDGTGKYAKFTLRVTN